MRVVRRVGWVALFAALGLLAWRFASHNAIPVSVDLVVTRLPEAPLWLGLVLAFAGGAAAAGLAALYEIARLSLLARRYRRAVVRLESEIHELRNLPLADEAQGPGGTARIPAPDG
jgi:uncharacterized integral membrane protein